MPGLPGQHTAFGHQKPWLLSAALASRIFPWQVVRVFLLAEVEHQILPFQAGSASLQLTLVLLAAMEEALLAQENQIASHSHHSPVFPEGLGPQPG